VIGVSARTIQRWKRHLDGDDQRCGPRHRPGNALSAREETQVLALLPSAAYGHLSPKQLVLRLADAGQYLASESTMYRLRRRLGLTPRRPPLLRTDVTRAATVHHAVRANQVWSWDSTYLPTVTRGRFLRLYLVMDVWSRRIVGWEVHEDELAERAATLIHRICTESGVDPNGLVLHSDNGKPMRGNTMIATLQYLDTHRRNNCTHVTGIDLMKVGCLASRLGECPNVYTRFGQNSASRPVRNMYTDSDSVISLRTGARPSKPARGANDRAQKADRREF
jgi:transposase InsO family protein